VLLSRGARLGCKANGFLDRPIKVEAGIDAESGTVIEEAAAGTFGLRENGIGLRQCEIGKRRREEIAGFRCEVSNVFGASSGLFVNRRQSIGLSGFIKSPVLCRIGKAALAARISQLHLPHPMRSCSDTVTSPRISSRFQRQLPGGRHDLVFRVAFGSDAAAARSLRRSKMTIWRWRHDRSPVPRWVFDVLVDLVQSKVADACAAGQDLNYLRQLPPRPPRPLTGCCARYR
jgi:hypothetical protein